MKSWSIASRLTTWVIASSVLLVASTTITIYWSLSRTLNNEDNLFLTDKIQTITHLLEARGNDLGSIRERVEKEWVSRKFERAYVKLLDPAGQAITATPGFDENLKSLFARISPVELGRGPITAQRTESKSGEVYKLVALLLPAEQGAREQSRILQIALDRTREETFLATYRSLLLLVLAASLILSAVVGRRLVVKGLQPISEITAAARKIRSTTLHERIGIAHVPNELRALVTTFNEMLDRLNESFDQLSRFSSDIAHDLRTPINNLRGELEVALGKPRTLGEYKDVLGSCLEECGRLSSLIDNLLFLARADNPRAHLSLESLDLSRELGRMAEFFEASAAEAGLQLELDVPEALQVRADRSLFQRAVGNIIANAIHYTPAGGRVRICARQNENVIAIRVEDTGQGIPEADLPKVFQRFYRVDPARSTHSGGVGLGLSIVKSIMTLHQGTVSIASKIKQGTSVELGFPNL